MDKIWYRNTVVLDDILSLGNGNMGGHLGIEFTELGDNFLKGRMPVDERTKQPFGILHGGASVALAETLGSVASALVVNRDEYMCVGLEVNANHVRSVSQGFVIGTCTAIHIGASTHVWDIRIHDPHDRLACISRLTVAVLKKR